MESLHTAMKETIEKLSMTLPYTSEDITEFVILSGVGCEELVRIISQLSGAGFANIKNLNILCKLDMFKSNVPEGTLQKAEELSDQELDIIDVLFKSCPIEKFIIKKVYQELGSFDATIKVIDHSRRLQVDPIIIVHIIKEFEAL